VGRDRLRPAQPGLDLGTIVERVEGALASLRIGHLAARDPARLSGGQAQLVALASVLAIQPRCLVLDEPTSQLDPEGTRLVGDAIRRIADQTGSAVLVVEHKTALLTEIADEAIVLDAGRVHAKGGVDEVLGDPSIVELGIDPPPLVRLRRALESAAAPAATIKRVVDAARTTGGAST
jgi:energy-coupling factor transport system ATP-binding protein